MNTHADPDGDTPILDNATLDRLVDGELSGPEFRAALRALEGQPESWRRCAIAFIEAQAWKRAVALGPEACRESRPPEPQADGSTAPGETIIPKSRRPRSLAPSHSVWTGWLSMAAVIALLAFFSGRASRERANSPDPPSVAERAAAGDAETGDAEIGGALAAGPNEKRQPLRETMKLVVEDPEGRRPPFELPVYNFHEVGGAWPGMQTTKVPRQVQNAIRRLGGQLRREQYLAPVRLEDGRHVLVPIERFQVYRIPGDPVY